MMKEADDPGGVEGRAEKVIAGPSPEDDETGTAPGMNKLFAAVFVAIPPLDADVIPVPGTTAIRFAPPAAPPLSTEKSVVGFVLA